MITPLPIDIARVSAQAFWRRVEIRGPDECWPWSDRRSPLGYGIFYCTNQGMRPAHRVSYLLEHGAIPEGRPLVLHTCDNPPCCNPAHLYAGTQLDNMHDKVQRGRCRGGSPGLKGEKHGRAKLTEAQVREMRRRAAAGETRVHLAACYGVSPSTVDAIVGRRNWTHIL